MCGECRHRSSIYLHTKALTAVFLKYDILLKILEFCLLEAPEHVKCILVVGSLQKQDFAFSK